MGLDNSIVAVSKTKIHALTEYLYGVDDGKFYYELCYYRKCWNIRYAVLHDVLHWKDDGTCGAHELSEANVRGIIKALWSFNAENWCQNGGSIWAFSDMRWTLWRHILRLKKLRRLMRKYGDKIEVYFEDSY